MRNLLRSVKHEEGNGERTIAVSGLPILEGKENRRKLHVEWWRVRWAAKTRKPTAGVEEVVLVV